LLKKETVLISKEKVNDVVDTTKGLVIYYSTVNKTNTLREYFMHYNKNMEGYDLGFKTL